MKLQEVDLSLEWLSVFVEDCLSSRGNCVPAPAPPIVQKPTSTSPKPRKPEEIHGSSLQKISVPCKARSKRKRVSPKTKTNPLTSWTKHINPQTQNLQSVVGATDPPLLHHQTYWLADSELILPKKEENVKGESEEEEEEKLGGQQQGQGQVQPRRCTHCLAQKTPQWRAGPLGPKTLCNACGVRYKSGRLLPEYRPAKSPTFVSYLHSNSHKKVLEMRMSF